MQTEAKDSNPIDTDFTKDLVNFFENFIKTSELVKEKEIVPDFIVKLKVLNTEELLMAEVVLSSSNPNIPSDVIIKVRSASILSRSILAINGLAVEREDLSKEDNFERRTNLYKQILRMPPLVIQKTYEFYVEAVKEQNKLYEEVGEKTENF